jgi:hypothetical protein
MYMSIFAFPPPFPFFPLVAKLRLLRSHRTEQCRAIERCIGQSPISCDLARCPYAFSEDSCSWVYRDIRLTNLGQERRAIRFVLDIPNSPLCSDSCARTAPDPPLPHLHRQCGQCAVCVCFLCCNHHRETWCSSSLNKLTRDQHIQHYVKRQAFLCKLCFPRASLLQ